MKYYLSFFSEIQYYNAAIKLKRVNGTPIPKTLFCFVFPLLSLCSQHNFDFKKIIIRQLREFSFFHIAALLPISKFYLRPVWQV
jgi:hypothetical protein